MGKNQLRLTPTEEQVMLRLSQLQKAAVAEILELYPEPKPAYNTVSTIVRILEKKKFIRHKQRGRGYEYTPRISKEEYRNILANHLIEHYFDNNSEELLSHYNKTKSLSDLLGKG